MMATLSPVSRTASPAPSVSAIILLWSAHSENCAKLRQMMSNADLQLFEKLCIDSPAIRQAILQSLHITITYVPCFLFLNSQGHLTDKHEGKAAFQWFADHSRRNQSIPTNPSPGSSVSQILGGMQALAQPRSLGSVPGYPTELSDDIRPLGGSQARGPSDIVQPRSSPDMGRVLRQPFQGISSERDMVNEEAGPVRPVKGEGHDGMISSLSGFGRSEDDNDRHMVGSDRMDPNEQYQPEPEPSSRMVPVGRGRGVKLIEDLTPDEPTADNGAISLDDDPSGMGIPRGDVPIVGKPPKNSTNADEITDRMQQMGQRGGRGSEKGKAIKELAATMVAQRDADFESQSQNRKAKAQPAQSKAKKTPVRLAKE